MDLHSKWGNRWSRIARNLPGRTDNEIKNYWRTQMRKQKAQDKNKPKPAPVPILSPTSSSSCIQSSLSSSNIINHVVDSRASNKNAGEQSFYDTGGPHNNEIIDVRVQENVEQEGYHYYSMDDIWKDIAVSEENKSILEQVYDGNSEEGCNFSNCPPMHSPSSWEYSSELLWLVMDELEESNNKVLFPTIDQYVPCYEQGSAFLTG